MFKVICCVFCVAITNIRYLLRRLYVCPTNHRTKKYQPKPKITYKMIQKYVEKKYGFKVHTVYNTELKRSLGITMYDALNAVEG